MSGCLQQFQTSLRAPSGDPLEAFMGTEGRYANFTRETFFLRCTGASEQHWDRLRLWAGSAGAGRVLARDLGRPSPEETARYIALYQEGRLPFRFQNPIWQAALEQGFDRIRELFQSSRGRSEEAILRNFSVRILYWMDRCFPRLFTETVKMNRFPKFVCGGRVKLSEYLFFYLLFLLGCDVLYLPPAGGFSLEDPALLALSLPAEAGPESQERPGIQEVRETRTPRVVLPPRDGRTRDRQASPGSAGSTETQAQQTAPGSSGTQTQQISPGSQVQRPVISAGRIRRPERHGPPPSPVSPPSPSPGAGSSAPSRRQAVPTPPPPSGDHPETRRPLEFEELARFASSVVMLKVFDDHDQCFKTGSGVIINEQGYVLTNLHVVSGGRYYGILLEEETDVFYTSELIKYNQDFDLAILRMEKRRKPIPISRGPGLVRGQKVVAIGSPLGLFNSVSDGIISGFRELEHVSMIQFTAPVSHGSSGGALLDMYGDLIGLITGGYNDGQNLNLAVDWQTITQFARGLL